MNAGSFPSTDTVEKKVFAFDFRKGLDHGETLIGASINIVVIDGSDAAAPSRLIGPPAIAGTTVKQRVGSLQVGASYRLMAVATTNQGNTKSLWARVECTA